FDDLIEAFVRVLRIGRTSITYDFSAWRRPDDTLLVQSTQTLVLVDSAERRPTPIPEELRAPLRAFEGADLEE
nr:acyl-CoA thioesterase [Actinomycetota bacterium]